LRFQLFEPALFVKQGGELQLSGAAITELLRAVLDKGVPFRFQAKGNSMSPFIKNGDVVTVYPLLDIPPTLGEVVAFTRPATGKLVLHRVIGRKDTAFLTSGDNSRAVDGLIPMAFILGKVKTVKRAGKKIQLGLGPERFLIVILIRSKLLAFVLLPAWRIIHPIIRRSRI
jgi:signal peptidase